MKIHINKDQIIGIQIYEGGQIPGIIRVKESKFMKPAGYYFNGKRIDIEDTIGQGVNKIINGELEANPLLKLLLVDDKYIYRYFDSLIILNKFVQEHFSDIPLMELTGDRWWNNFK